MANEKEHLNKFMKQSIIDFWFFKRISDKMYAISENILFPHQIPIHLIIRVCHYFGYDKWGEGQRVTYSFCSKIRISIGSLWMITKTRLTLFRVVRKSSSKIYLYKSNTSIRPILLLIPRDVHVMVLMYKRWKSSQRDALYLD